MPKNVTVLQSWKELYSFGLIYWLEWQFMTFVIFDELYNYMLEYSVNNKGLLMSRLNSEYWFYTLLNLRLNTLLVLDEKHQKWGKNCDKILFNFRVFHNEIVELNSLLNDLRFLFFLLVVISLKCYTVF